MKAITARKAAAHITPLMDAMWHRGIVETENCIFDSFEKFEADIASNNEIRIRSGAGMLQGRFFCIEPGTYDSAAIANGTQGEKRTDLIVARWTVDASSETEDVEIKVLQGAPTTGTPVAPDYTGGDLDGGELIADMPLYEVNLNGITIENVTPQFEAGWFPKDSVLPISKGGTGKTTAEAALTALGGASIKKLWTNASPSSSFAAQSISLNISGYSYIAMLCNYTTGYPKRLLLSGLCPVETGYQAACVSPDTIRTIEVESNTSVKIGGTSNGNASELVPCYIIGIKGVK